MTPIDFEKKLQDYVDGLLDADEAAGFEAWLEKHPDERRLLEQTRAVKQAAAALPREVAPARDLWPAIRARLPEGHAAAHEADGRLDRPGMQGSAPEPRVVPLAPRRVARPSWWGALAATLLAAAVLVTMRWPTADRPAVDGSPTEVAAAGDVGPRPGAVSAPTPLAAPAAMSLPATAEGFDAALAAAEADFLRATGDLMALLESRRDRLPPQTLESVQQNLTLMSEAIDEIHAALEAEPGNPAHGRALAAMYKRRMQLLWIATELSRET